MIVVLAAGTVLIAIALVTGLRTRADRVTPLGLVPPPARRPEPGATSMTVHKAFRARWFNSRRLPVDEAYTAWFNANSRELNHRARKALWTVVEVAPGSGCRAGGGTRRRRGTRAARVRRPVTRAMAMRTVPAASTTIIAGRLRSWLACPRC